MKKVLLLADSLALPRYSGQEKDQGDPVPFETTYPFLLEKYFREEYKENAPLLINRAKRSRTIKIVVDDIYEEVELKLPQIVIVHVGVVDCAPRVFSRLENAIVNKLGFIRPYILKFVNRYRRRLILLRPNRVYVSERAFSSYLDRFLSKLRENGVEACALVGIISPPDSSEYRSPGFQRNVDIYNSIIRSRCDNRFAFFIDLNSLIIEHGGSEKLTVDGIHIGVGGHKVLFGALKSFLQNRIPRE